MKTYIVPVEGKVFYEIAVKSDSPKGAIQEAYKQVDKINEKAIVTVDWWYDAIEDDVVELTEDNINQTFTKNFSSNIQSVTDFMKEN